MQPLLFFCIKYLSLLHTFRHTDLIRFHALRVNEFVVPENFFVLNLSFLYYYCLATVEIIKQQVTIIYSLVSLLNQSMPVA